MVSTIHSFSARIRKVGINPCVDVPKHISAAFGIRSNVPVKGRLNKTPIRATLVPLGSGRRRLYLNGEMRTKANVGVGDSVTIRLQHNTAPRVVPMPRALSSALKRSRAAGAAFEQMPASWQKQVFLYMRSLKRPESIERNVRKVINSLREE